jgi:hypothetical protein
MTRLGGWHPGAEGSAMDAVKPVLRWMRSSRSIAYGLRNGITLQTTEPARTRTRPPHIARFANLRIR